MGKSKKSSLKKVWITFSLDDRPCVLVNQSSRQDSLFVQFLCFSKDICFFLPFLFMSVFYLNLYISTQNYLHHLNHILYKSLLFGGVRYTDYVGDCPLLSNGRGTWGYFHITQSHNRPTICLISLQSLYFHFLLFLWKQPLFQTKLFEEYDMNLHWWLF